uniref:Aldose 1-epimerase n=1 Tax=Oryza sativa subsp. japonica TaxID=39947 RepID=Q7XV01_ORYSJ|nr:OSJNBa0036B21.18 [Oryza sativa Japonica Group]
MARPAPLLLLLAAVCLVAAASAGGADAAERKATTVGVYELRKGDFSIRVTNWGAVIMSVVLPDSRGKLDDVVLGYDTIAEYVNSSTYFGALVGRVANRIAKARFVLDGKAYHLYPNDGKNTLHGILEKFPEVQEIHGAWFISTNSGHRGFSNVTWTVKEHVGGGDAPYITLYYHSFDGEQGFPGALDVYVTYQLSGPYVLSVHMNATAAGKATPVNLAQHSYWNLGGTGSGDILGNTVQLFASRYTPVDAELIPTGQVAPVTGTPCDLRAPTPVGARVHLVTGGLSKTGATIYGFDTNYAVDGGDDVDAHAHALRRVTVVRDGKSGRSLELWANQPGVQFYTGNFLTADVKGKGGKAYGQYGALCLETQGFPDAVNHPNFPSVIVRPGQVYKHEMVYKFSF